MRATTPEPVTVVIPVHDRAELLGRALASVARQTAQVAEVIVIDDGSTDDSAGVAERTGARVVRQPQSGVSAARNRGLREARTHWVAFLDSDDEWMPDHLSGLLDWAADHSFVSAGAVTNEGALVGSLRTRALLLRTADRLVWPDNPVVTSAVMDDRATALETGGFDPELRFSEDLDLWARLLDRAPGLILAGITVRYHLHPGQVSADLASMRSGEQRLLESGRVSLRTAKAVRIRDRWDALRRSGAGAAHLARFALRRIVTIGPLTAHRLRGRALAARFHRG